MCAPSASAKFSPIDAVLSSSSVDTLVMAMEMRQNTLLAFMRIVLPRTKIRRLVTILTRTVLFAISLALEKRQWCS